MGELNNYLRLEAGELKPKDEARIKAALTFNPQPDVVVWSYRKRRSTGALWLPRGIVPSLPSYVSWRDKRAFPKLPKFIPNIVLDYKSDDKSFEGQAECVEAMFVKQQGLVHRQPGTGKTQIGLYFAATVGTRTLVIVHTKDLLNQWINYAKVAVPDMPVGMVASGKEDIQQLTISTIQTLYRNCYDEKWFRQFGCVIVDEVHHSPSETFQVVISKTAPRYLFGFSASKTRADKMEPLMEHYIGPVIHELKFSSPVPVSVVKLKTEFRAGKNGNIVGPVWLRRKRWSVMIKNLIDDPKRNRKIAKAVAKEVKAGRSSLVLSRRVDHLASLQEALAAQGVEATILAAKVTPKLRRKEIVEEFKRGEIKCVLATQLADEGLDVPNLSCICLAFPGKHSDLILQQVGRALREFKGKTSAVVIDVVDPNVKVLRSQWHTRRRAYLSWGFHIKMDKANVIPKPIRRMVYGRIR